MRDLILFAIFMVLALMSLRRAHLGVMLWVWSALFPPNEYLYGFAQGVPFNKIAVACTVIGLAMEKRRNFSFDLILTVLVMFLIQVSLAYFFTEAPSGWGNQYYEQLTKIVIAAFMLRFVVVDRLRMQSVILAITLAISACGVMEAGKVALSGGGHKAQGPASWGDNNSTATMILMAMPLLLYLRNYSTSKIFRNISLGIFVACVLAVAGTFSRGGFLGLMILFVSMIIISKRRLPMIIGLALVLVAGISLAPDSWFNRMDSTAQAGTDSSFMQRVVQWKVLTLMALDHPLLGGGIISNIYRPIWQPYAGRLANTLTFIHTPDPDVPHASHSIYFQILGETGFPGLFLFLLLFTVSLRRAKAIRNDARGKPEWSWAGDLATAIRLSLLMYMITGAALPIPYFESPYLLMACVSALRWIQVEGTKATEVTGSKWIKKTSRAPLELNEAK